MPIAPGTDSLARDALHRSVRKVVHDSPALPLPGAGQTLDRWRQLAAFAAADVCLAKIVEAHYDALAIWTELRPDDPPPRGVLAVWAAEPPGLALDYLDGNISGTKAWCSGASFADGALLTVGRCGSAQLVSVDMGLDGIAYDDSRWQAVGMRRVDSGDVHFDAVPVELVGQPKAYVERPGFWHGGAGVAACWFGATCAIAEKLRADPRALKDPHAQAHLGAIDAHLAAAAAQLRHTAACIDREPELQHWTEVMRSRSVVEQAATEAIERVGRALGPGPLCQDRSHAQRCVDLSVFIRQSHAERDWATLGEAAARRDATWSL